MGGATNYTWLRLQHDRKTPEAAHEALTANWLPQLAKEGAGLWGGFAGHFGLHSREILLVLSFPARRPSLPEAFIGLLPTGFEAIDTMVLRATSRPDSASPLERTGLYVHRLFETDDRAVEEIVSLSTEAWETFETSDRYQSRPMGLFREQQAGRIRMLLVAWYENFAAWEESRTPPPIAAENFRRRAELTRGTEAIATRLLRRSAD